MTRQEARVGTPVIWWRVVSNREGYIQPVNGVIAEGAPWKGRTPKVLIVATLKGEQVRRYVDLEQVWRVEPEQAALRGGQAR